MVNIVEARTALEAAQNIRGQSCTYNSYCKDTGCLLATQALAPLELDNVADDIRAEYTAAAIGPASIRRLFGVYQCAIAHTLIGIVNDYLK